MVLLLIHLHMCAIDGTVNYPTASGVPNLDFYLFVCEFGCVFFDSPAERLPESTNLAVCVRLGQPMWGIC